jgi:hypothetical protein
MRKLLMICAIIVLTSSSAAAQVGAFTFKAGKSDFRLDEVAKSFVTSGGGLVQIVESAFAGTGGLGAEFQVFSESFRWSFNFGAEYRAANLFGSGGFHAKYAPDAQNPVFGPDTVIKDATAYFRSTIGFGFTPIKMGPAFLIISPNLDLQWGQRVFLDDAYKAYLARGGFSQPEDFKWENSLLVGYVVRATAGMQLSDDYALTFSPGGLWTYRFNESYQGNQYSGITSGGKSFGYEFSFGLMKTFPVTFTRW